MPGSVGTDGALQAELRREGQARVKHIAAPKTGLRPRTKRYLRLAEEDATNSPRDLMAPALPKGSRNPSVPRELGVWVRKARRGQVYLTQEGPSAGSAVPRQRGG